MNATASPRRIPILNYHSVSTSPPAAIAPFAVGPVDLARHLDLVVAGGHTSVTISDLVALLDGEVPLTPGTVVITFDDGYEDNLTVAAPMLAERRLPATVYVTTGFLAGAGRPPSRPPGRMVAWDGLVDLEAAGIEVGSHAHTHRQLDVLSHAEARREIRLSKDLLEAVLRHPVRGFAYPHGYAGRWVEEEVRRCGFASACGVRNAFSHPQDNRWHLARLTVDASTTAEQVRHWLNGSWAPVASPGEDLRTTAWRQARRAGAICRRASAPMFVRRGDAS